MKQSVDRTYYVDTDCFYKADQAAKARAKELGVDLDKYNNSAMAALDVLKVQAI